MADATENHWKFERQGSGYCVVKDASGTVYCSAHGDLAAHRCQDYMRWTALPDYPGGPEKEAFGLKPASPRCSTKGCHNRVDEGDDICHGCEADASHRNLWGSGIPMSHHAAS